MSRGFVTVACGREEYYIMAYNLLRSYRLHNPDGAPFAIVCDKENGYTEGFDKVIILKDPCFSYLDKIKMLSTSPYDENIFIDADCLCYRNIQDFWDDMPEKGVSCYGTVLEENADQGWFKKNEIEPSYADRVHYSIDLHSGLIFFRNDETTKQVFVDCMDIISNYSKQHFRMFIKPADEPVLALSMAMNSCYPIMNSGNRFLFFPMAKKISGNVVDGNLSYTKDGKDWVRDVGIIHWQNIGTEKPRYKSEIIRLSDTISFIKRASIIDAYLKDFILRCKRDYYPWLKYEINTKILRKKK